jgi:hypothetical protein
MRKKTGAGLLFFSISLLFSCAGSCAVDRDETLRISAAEAELRLIMFQIESRIIHFDALSDPEYIARIAGRAVALYEQRR